MDETPHIVSGKEMPASANHSDISGVVASSEEEVALVDMCEILLQNVVSLEILGEEQRGAIDKVENMVAGDAAYWDQMNQHYLQVSRLFNQYNNCPHAFTAKDVGDLVLAAKQLQQSLDMNYQRSFIHSRYLDRVVSSLSVTARELRYRHRVVDSYRVRAEDVTIDLRILLGAGGFGEVYAGRYKYREGDVALKVMKTEHISQYDDADGGIS